jgi:hypothetical protein
VREVQYHIQAPSTECGSVYWVTHLYTSDDSMGVLYPVQGDALCWKEQRSCSVTENSVLETEDG